MLYFFAWLAPLTRYTIDNPEIWLHSLSLVFSCESFFEVASRIFTFISFPKLMIPFLMTGVVWDSSNDVIAISVRHANTNTGVTILSQDF